MRQRERVLPIDLAWKDAKGLRVKPPWANTVPVSGLAENPNGLDFLQAFRSSIRRLRHTEFTELTLDMP